METKEIETGNSTTTEETTVNTISKEEFDKVVKEREQAKKDLQSALAQKEHWRTKAESKEETKVETKIETKEEKDTLLPEDLYALMEAKVPREDIVEVKRAAQLWGKSITEVLNDPLLKATLSARSEERATAAAAITKNNRPATKETEEGIINKALRGEIPDDANEIEKLAAARMKSRLKK